MNAPAETPPWAKSLGDGAWHLFVYVQPGAKKSEVTGTAEGRLRLRIAAQAVDNKANKALIVFLAKLLGVKQNRVRLESGGTSRKKTLKVSDLTELDWSALGVPDVPS